MIHGARVENGPNGAVTSGQRRKVWSNLSELDTERVGKGNSLLGRVEKIMFQREKKRLFHI